jgi:cysteine-rich repeat protein
MDCDDTQACNGAESCNDHVCAAGVPLEPGASCTRTDGSEGVCRGDGLAAECANAGCGNGVVDGSEDCDDMNTENGDGCDNDCTFTCNVDADCIPFDMNVCDGADVCNAAEHTCGPGTMLDCSDGLDCTDDSCDATSGCAHTDNGTGEFWYADCDLDGYAFNELGAERHCIRPTTVPGQCGATGAWTSRRPIGTEADCLDNDPNVRPGADTFRTTPIPGAVASADFDYNCDGLEETIPGAAVGVCQCTGDWYVDNRPESASTLVCGGRQTYKWACTRDTNGACIGYWSRTSASEVIPCR